jgi:hypothetical protein
MKHKCGEEPDELRLKRLRWEKENPPKYNVGDIVISKYKTDLKIKIEGIQGSPLLYKSSKPMWLYVFHKDNQPYYLAEDEIITQF